MNIRYDIKVTIANKNTGACSSFPAKTFETEITAPTDSLLYDNHHIIAQNVYLFDIFRDEVSTYSNALGVPVNELEFDSFEVTALAPPEQYQVYFDFDSDEQQQNLRPTIKVYIAPKESRLLQPTLKGTALDKNSILWQWNDDGFAHYLVTEAIDPTNPNDADKIIAQLPIGVSEHLETPLDPGTAYTRRLIAYTDTQYSDVSAACTVWTETVSPDIILNEYETPRLYDFTIDEFQREIIDERMKAFHSGIGDFTDLQVYKQMDADFYQKFKAYFEITGRRIQREKRYDQVGFWYKVCLDGMERIEEQEGEVTFDVYAYPREWLRLQDYVWAVKDVQVRAEFEASVFLQKESDGEYEHQVEVYECTTEEVPDNIDEPGKWVWGTPGKWKKEGKGTYKYKIPGTPGTDEKKEFIANPLSIVLIIDRTKSLLLINEVGNLKTAILNCLEEIKKKCDALGPGGVDGPYFTIILFRTTAVTVLRHGNYTQAVSTINREITNAQYNTNTTKDGYSLGSTQTSWYAGLTKGADEIESYSSKNIVLFFSDGGSNYGTQMTDGYDGASYTNGPKTYAWPTQGLLDGWIYPAANRLGGNANVIAMMPIIFKYKWGYDTNGNQRTYVGADHEFVEVDGGTVTCIYDRWRSESASEYLAFNKYTGSRGNVIWWGPNTTFDLPTAFMEAFRAMLKTTPGTAGTSEQNGSKQFLSWTEVLADTSFVAKVREAIIASGANISTVSGDVDFNGFYGWDPKPGHTEGESYTLPAGAVWTVEPVSGSKDGLYTDDSGLTPTLASSTDIPAQYKPGGATPGHWDPAPKHEDRVKTVFKGWGPNPIKLDAVSKYNLDNIIKVKVHGGPYFYTFTNDVTPVKYSRKEKRAIVSTVLSDDASRNYFVDAAGNKVMILSEIMRLVEETPEWQSGYQTYVMTSNGKMMIEGLFIKDNYAIGDDDANFDMDFSEGWRPGMEGSVNAYTKVDRGASSSYGDDCYLIDSSSVLQIQGYTDAMIFDGEHAISAELNAYDYPTVRAIYADGSVIVDNNTNIPCSRFMFNRKDKTLQYDGTGGYSHCVDIVQCDRDIILRGFTDLRQEVVEGSEEEDHDEDPGGAGQNIVKRRNQKYQVFDPMETDIEGSIEVWYRSPVLNYRFNIEDPDAKTSIYEILPDCNPEDDFLHVVLLHVYYARNVYITDGPNPNALPDPDTLTGTPQLQFNYVGEYGDDPIAEHNDPNLLDDDPANAEGLYKWTQKMWQNSLRYDNGWYLDDFVWFQAEKMMKDITYHDEIPGHGMQPMYGLVNGRYTSKNQDGKQDLLVQVPQFNIPTTVRDYYIHYGGSRTPVNWNGDGEHPLKIYIVLTEFHPKDALVGYKWERDCQWVNPETGKVCDDITQDYKGCYATFSCDSVTFKDIEYYDLVETINFENQEVFDTKNNIIHYQLTKPETEHEYVNYYLKVSTDNSDVIALNYPGEIMFDEDGHADFGVTYKGVVNATTMWSPRIHNGYYYLNQHEYFAYSEFNFDHDRTRVKHNDTEHCITVFGHMTFDVTLCHVAAPPEIYRGDDAIVKENRSSLLQNENHFQWVDGKGVTLRPSIDGQYYKKYETYMYYSPILSFPHTLTEHGPVSIDYFIEDGTTELMGVEIRSYILEEGKWSDWYPLAGVEVPCSPNTDYTLPTDLPLSHAYQLRFYLQASVVDKPKTIEDYLCCYLDWKDDGEESLCYNIVTVTDHMTTGPYHGKGVFVSKIFDFGCPSTMALDMFQSNGDDEIKLYVAGSVSKTELYMENAAWQDISEGGTISDRYIRYKIEIPEGKKLYWLHKTIGTLETEATLPYICGFKMEGEYHPTDIITNFINTEAFEILADGNQHVLPEFADLTKIIGDDVLDRGYTMSEIKKVDIRCTTSNINIVYNSNLLNEYPGNALKNTQLKAETPLQTVFDINYTPYIFLDDDDMGDKITVYGATPQQYCPITVEDPDGLPYIQLHECTDFEQRMTIICSEKTKFIELPTNRYDILTMKVKVNGVFLTDTEYRIVNHIIIFNDFVELGDTIEVIYHVMYSFIAEVDRYGDETTPPNTIIYLYTGYQLDENGETQYIPAAEKYKIFFETGLRNNKFTANKLSLNPIYRTDYKGFIYLTDDNNEPYTVKIYCNPRRIKAGGYDKVDVSVEVLDILGNPVINREVYIDCGATEDDENSFDRGVISCGNNMTDMNGVVHFIYESSVLPVEATIRASVFNCAGASIEDSITIVNE